MLVLMEEAAEVGVSVDVEPGDAHGIDDGCGQRMQWSGIVDALMRPVGVVEPLELSQGVDQVALIPDQGAVEQLAAAGLYPALHDRVRAGYPDDGEHDTDPASASTASNPAGECAVAVSDHESGLAADVP
jgi:hypothetical protein